MSKHKGKMARDVNRIVASENRSKPSKNKMKRVAKDIARENRSLPTMGVRTGPGDPRITVAVPTIARAIGQTNRKDV